MDKLPPKAQTQIFFTLGQGPEPMVRNGGNFTEMRNQTWQEYHQLRGTKQKLESFRNLSDYGVLDQLGEKVKYILNSISHFNLIPGVKSL